MELSDLLKLSIKEVDKLFGAGRTTRELTEKYVEAWNSSGTKFCTAHVMVNYIRLDCKEK